MKRSGNGRRPTGNLSEIGPVLFILLLVVFFPLIDLLGVGTGMVTIVLLTNQSASRAANQTSYDSALAAMTQEANQALTTGFAHFAKLKPAGGYQSCGTDLYVQATNYRQGGTTRIGPNIPVPPPIDLSSKVYELTAHGEYDTGPTVSLAAVPYIGSIPGLGKPVRLAFEASRTAEHPAGLDNGIDNIASTAGGSVAKFNTTPTGNLGGGGGGLSGGGALPSGGVNDSGWNYPGIYQAIAQRGQTIVAQNVMIVKATDDWDTTLINVSPGETVWVDSRADGLWADNPIPPATAFNANGFTNAQAQFKVYTPAVEGCLIGCVGTPPAVAAASGGVNAPNLFACNQTLISYPVTGNGAISLMINDNYRPNNAGQMEVRIIVTR